jgi:hypothetical protein
MADWNNETDSIVIGKGVNANSDPSGVNGTMQGNNGKATTCTTTFRIGLGGIFEGSWTWILGEFIGASYILFFTSESLSQAATETN